MGLPSVLPSVPSNPLKAIADFVFTFVDKAVVEALPEYGHLAPAIIIVGSLITSLATLNFPIFMIAASSAEAKWVEGVIFGFMSYIQNPAELSSSPEPSNPGKCGSKFSSYVPSRFETLVGQGLMRSFPNSPIYFLSFFVAYCFQCLLFFSKEMSEYGPNYSSRTYMAILSGSMFVLLYAAYLYANGCVGIGGLFVSILVGALVGYLIAVQNYMLLGKSAVNLTFIPPIQERKGLDYVCVTHSKKDT
jgi:hypothetical protein